MSADIAIPHAYENSQSYRADGYCAECLARPTDPTFAEWHDANRGRRCASCADLQADHGPENADDPGDFGMTLCDGYRPARDAMDDLDDAINALVRRGTDTAEREHDLARILLAGSPWEDVTRP